MKSIFQYIKRLIMSFLILYSYNLIAVNFNMVIPINFITLGLLTFLGTPSLLALLLLKIVLLWKWGDIIEWCLWRTKKIL